MSCTDGNHHRTAASDPTGSSVHKISGSAAVVHTRRGIGIDGGHGAHTETVDASTEAGFLLVSADQTLVDQVMAVAATVAVDPVVVGDCSQALVHWAGSSVVLVGQDLAVSVAEVSPPAGPAVYLIGSDPVVLSAWSMPLRATVIEIPAGAAWLTGILAGGAPGVRCPVVSVVGATGGVGASTLAAGLAFRAAQRGTSSVVVDADPFGGGIDLLFGAERSSGWRWDRFTHAEGQMGDLRPVLPEVDGVSLLSMGRRSASHLACEPISAVIGSLRRTFDLVIVDPGRTHLPASLECRRLSTASILIVPCSVRGVASAQQHLADWIGPPARLVARAHRAGGFGPEVLAAKLNMGLAATLPDELQVATATERGDPPGRSLHRRRGWGRACADLLADLT